MEEKKLAELLEKFLDGELSPEEEKSLKKEEYGKLFSSIQNYSEMQRSDGLVNQEVLDEKFRDLIEKISKEERSESRLSRMKYKLLVGAFAVAASLVVVFSAGKFGDKKDGESGDAFYSGSFTVQAEEYSERGVEVRSSFQIVSNDGSEILKDQISVSPEVLFEVEQKSDTESVVRFKEALPAGEKITLRIGDEENGSQYVFKTVPELKIIGTTPTNLSIAPENTAVEIEFNYESFDLESVKERFTITPEISGEWEKLESKAVFVPEDNFVSGQIYSVEIIAGITESNGKITSESVNFSFKSESQTSRGSDEPSIYVRRSLEQIVSGSDIQFQGIWANNIKDDVSAKVLYYKIDDFDEVLPYLVYPDDEGRINAELKPDFDLMTPEFEIEVDFEPNSYDKTSGEYLVPYPESNGIYFTTFEVVQDDQVLEDWWITNVSKINSALVTDFSTGYYDYFDGEAESGNYMIYAVDSATGENIENAKIYGYNLEKDVSEIFYSDFDNAVFESRKNDADILVVEKDGNYSFLEFRKPVFYGYYNYDLVDDYYISSWYSPNLSGEYIVFPVFDKTLYSPGDEVRLEVIFRESENYSYPKIDDARAENFTAEIYLPTNEYQSEKFSTVKSNGIRNGFFEVNFDIPENSKTGYGTIVFFYKDEVVGSERFQIEEYKKPQARMEIDFPDRVVSGELTSGVVTGDYYFGAPLSGKQVAEKVYSGDMYYYSYNKGELVKDEELTLDENGKANFEISLDYNLSSYEASSTTYPKNAIVEFLTEDDLGDPIVSSKSILFYPAEVLVEAKLRDYYIRIGEGAEFDLNTKNYKGEEVGNVKIEVTVERRWWDKIQTGTNYNSKTKLTYPTYRYEDRSEILNTETIYTDINTAKTEYSFSPDEPGSYRVYFKSYDDQGRFYQKVNYVWVTGDDYSRFFNNDYEQIKILDTEGEIKPEGTFNYTVFSQIEEDTNALAIYSQDSFRKYEIFELKNGENVMNIDLDESYSPGFTVTIIALGRGGEKNYKFTTFETEKSKKQIFTELIVPGSALPGEEIEAQIITRDNSGNGISAEGLVRVLDQSLIDISNEEDSKMDQEFLNYRGNSLQVSFPYSISIYTDESMLGGGRGGMEDGVFANVSAPMSESKSSEVPAEGESRSDFRDIAEFTTFKTGADGTVKLKIKMPENLTEWNLKTFSITDDGKVGEAEDSFVTTKDFVVLSSAPSFLRKGDQIVVPLTIINFLERDVQGSLNISVKGGQLLDEPFRDLIVPGNGGKATPTFTLFAGESGSVEIEITASTRSGASDGIKFNIPVLAVGRPLSDSEFKKLTPDNNEFNFNLNYDSTLDPNSTEINLTLSPTSLPDMIDGIKYLAQFPYGCNEQSVSKSFVNLELYKNYESLDQLGVIDLKKETLEEYIFEGVNRIEMEVRENGAVGWFAYDADDPFLSLYALNFVSQAGEFESFRITDSKFSRMVNYAKEVLADEDATPEMRIFALYTLSQISGSEPIIEAKNFYDAYVTGDAEISVSSLGFLASALENNGDKSMASATLEKMEDKLIKEKTFAYAEENRSDYKKITGSKEFETGVALFSAREIGVDKAWVDKISSWISKEKNGRGYWSSTLETSIITRGLIKEVVASSSKENVEFEVYLNDKMLSREKFENGKLNGKSVTSIGIGGGDLQDGENVVWVKMISGDNLFVGLNYKNFATEWTFQEEKIAVDRVYLKDGVEIEPDSLTRGDLVTVRMTMRPELETNYMFMEDYFPATFEPVNPRLSKKFSYEELQNDSDNWYSRWAVSSADFRQDKIAVFWRNWREGEEVEIEYKARVLYPGVFYTNGTFANSFYFPEISGWASGEKVEVN